MAEQRRKSVLITGCSEGGTGNALAKEYCGHGFHVFATARRIEAMQNLALLNGITLIQLDVTSIPSVSSVLQTVSEILERENMSLNILVNNAGVSSVIPTVDMPLQASHNIIQTNLLGPMNMVHYFMPLLLRAASSPDGNVCIVNTGSVAGLLPLVGASYNASKAALKMWSDSLRLELEPLNIRVLHLAMGFIDTSMWGRARESLPAGSRYASIENLLVDHRLSFRQNSMSTSQFAQRVVSVSSKTNPPTTLYIGKGAFRYWVISWLLPQWLRDYEISRSLGLWGLGAALRKA
ncbi:hypothetical protein M408DRAFT_332821 [Serendipita vermifera MAFF 305830]|uniref:Uncharacterized protein n=1 Tax=Serendipita vermifera MAFF 305830 TaxID=933852 RepID=A0A0C2WZC9_SERVB|nr:hypothetical protein M408DRAFT_332821 [Serendipita vermifera MAFF 305830]